MQKYFHILSFLIILLYLSGCSIQPRSPLPKKELPVLTKSTPNPMVSLRVTATAYTSRRKETDSTPFLAAWNNRLRPGIKSIAVSRDLLRMGLTNRMKVRIDGLPGTYTVLDKMNKRWKKKIDIYMGLNLRKAKRWGKRKVTIRWKKKAKAKAKKHISLTSVK